MISVTLIFYGNLKDLLKKGLPQNGIIHHSLNRRASVKDVIESFGVPHPEIQWLKINGQQLGFDSILQDKDKVEISPLTPPFDVFKVSILRPDPLEKIRFVVDVNVGKLAALLRMAGFDTVYQNSLIDVDLADIADQEKRVLLTKDCNLLKRKKVVFGHLVREIQPLRQFPEIINLFQLIKKMRPFSRCLLCNSLLKPVAKEDILHRLEPLTKKYYNSFQFCPECDKIYWPGSHRQKMQGYFHALTSKNELI